MPIYIVSSQVFSLKYVSECIHYYKTLHLELNSWKTPAGLCQNYLNETNEWVENYFVVLAEAVLL